MGPSISTTCVPATDMVDLSLCCQPPMRHFKTFQKIIWSKGCIGYLWGFGDLGKLVGNTEILPSQ